jgi:predicted DNA-binding antitoxin AbrB/MazE fold protein
VKVKRRIEAVYEDDVFRPLRPVEDLPNRTRLTIEVSDPEEGAQGQMPGAEKERIALIERLARGAFGNLDPAEETAVRAARLDQQHFFDRTLS